MGTKNKLDCLQFVMKKNYIQYRASQFATDPFFLQWRMVGDKRSSYFWETFIREHPEKEDEIRKAIRIAGTIRMNDYVFSSLEKKRLLERIIVSGRVYRRRKQHRLIVYSAAAGLVLLLSLTWLLPTDSSDSSTGGQTMASLSAADEHIRLITAAQKTFELSNNADIVYRSQGNIQVKDGRQNEIWQEEVTETVGMNTLIVPFGKRTSLTLPDSTQIWLNAGSRVEFPSRFAEGKREIYAEGEVYLEVAKDTERPFTVRTPFYDVRVLGTKFVVSAYKNETEHAVVLAEGTVEVGLQNQLPCRLSPNHKWSVNDRKTKITEVVPYEYFCWKDGVLQFSQETLSTILHRISRYYGVKIDYVPGEEERISGKLVLFEDVRTVLDNITVILPVTYTIHDQEIHITKTLN